MADLYPPIGEVAVVLGHVHVTHQIAQRFVESFPHVLAGRVVIGDDHDPETEVLGVGLHPGEPPILGRSRARNPDHRLRGLEVPRRDRIGDALDEQREVLVVERIDIERDWAGALRSRPLHPSRVPDCTVLPIPRHAVLEEREPITQSSELVLDKLDLEVIDRRLASYVVPAPFPGELGPETSTDLERFRVALRRIKRFLDRRISRGWRRCRLPAGHGVAHLLP